MRRAFPLSSLIHHSNPAERFELRANDTPAVSVQLKPGHFSAAWTVVILPLVKLFLRKH
jgi:hypothetical protein